MENLLEIAENIIAEEPRLIQLPAEGKAVFVGDTHGDLDATEEVIRKYLKEPYRIVFLGDYVDRGDSSEQNVCYLLQVKREHPDRVFLLAGNHEGYMVKSHHPADFWDSLPASGREAYGRLFSKFPLVASSQNGILAVHGVLPDVDSLDDMNRIEWGDAQWDRIVWGDFVEREIDTAGDWRGRPQFGRKYFERLMNRYGKSVLVRSHQPYAPPLMFNSKCVTIFTSHAYLPIRTVVVADLREEVRTARDLVFERI